MSALTLLLLLSPLLARPLGVWEPVQHALEVWLQPTGLAVNTSGPKPVRRPVQDGQPAFYRQAMDASMAALVESRLMTTCSQAPLNSSQQM